ncbi:ABC transporter permease [Streptomyces sp. NPDC091292]|uniref:ABC transporter permease n=1 Tax=Streptomyces sp. NPDC091292 TaxID=3365991 RepID=UPI00382A2711
MNFLKRAGLSLWSRKGKTLIMLGTFLVISAMVLGGVLIEDATARAGDAAKRKIGAEVTLAIDFDKLTADGGSGLSAPQMATATIDQIGKSPLVKHYNYEGIQFTDLADPLTYEGKPTEKDKDRDRDRDRERHPDGIPPMSQLPLVKGVLESGAMPGFSSGRWKLLDGEPITLADRDREVVLIEERLAKLNALKVGDRIKLGRIKTDPSTEKQTVDGYTEFTVGGIYRDPGDQDPDYLVPAGNRLIAPIAAAAEALGEDGKVPAQVGGATFTLNDPGDFPAFKKHAEDVAGAQLDPFALQINDKAIKQMTGPLSAVTSSAGLAMWLIGVAGAAVLALLTTLAVKQRRKEFGVLLSMGEPPWKLVAQQVTEIVVVAALAVGLSALFTEALTQKAAGSLVSGEADSARAELAAWEPPPPGSTGLGQGIDPGSEPVEGADPIDKITVRLDNGALATVAGVGLGIGLLATVMPAASVLRLSPRTILSKGE